MQNGFGSLDPVKLKESSLRDYSVEDIRKFLDAYKNYRSDDDDQFRNLLSILFLLIFLNLIFPFSDSGCLKFSIHSLTLNLLSLSLFFQI